jgi:hypothetical protein
MFLDTASLILHAKWDEPAKRYADTGNIIRYAASLKDVGTHCGHY